MARAQDPNSADSQFYIMFAPAPHLDRQYTVWGQVVEGMEFVDMIKKGSPSRNGSVTEPTASSRCRSPPTPSKAFGYVTGPIRRALSRPYGRGRFWLKSPITSDRSGQAN